MEERASRVDVEGAGRRCRGSCLAAGAAWSGSADRGRAAATAYLRVGDLPLAIPRYQQEPHPPLVRYEDLRQSREGAPLQRRTPELRSAKLACGEDLRKIRAERSDWTSQRAAYGSVSWLTVRSPRLTAPAIRRSR